VYFSSSRERLLFLVARFVGRDLGNAYGPGRGRIWLEEVECNGSENNIADCSHNAWGSNDCGHHEDVSIRCMRRYNYGRGTTRLSHRSVTICVMASACHVIRNDLLYVE